MLKSAYFHLALALNLFCWGLWSQPNWWDVIFSVIPNLLGFTLGGFAIFVGFGDEKFISSLAEMEDDPSAPSVYREFCATFVHFIVIQVVSLLLAVISKGMYFQADLPDWVSSVIKIGNIAWGALCFSVFLYALTSVLAIGFHVFRISNMYELHHRMLEAQARKRKAAEAEQAEAEAREREAAEEARLGMIRIEARAREATERKRQALADADQRRRRRAALIRRGGRSSRD